MAARLNTLHNQDCITGLKRLDDGVVDLAFADPPFNIGYEYDVYEDAQEGEKYLAWSRDWTAEVVRVLKPEGTFWLAIGDEYAAELKVILQREHGLTCRSWVVWYYTFGVNCTQKFSRSHAHLLHMVKNPGAFTFNADAIRVPSARQLVYGDKRANPKGRLPDDTWILRPQDLPEGFRRRHLVLPPRLRHVQRACRLARLSDARATAGPNHPGVQQPGRFGAGSVCRKRNDLGRGQEAPPAFPRIRAIQAVLGASQEAAGEDQARRSAERGPGTVDQRAGHRQWHQARRPPAQHRQATFEADCRQRAADPAAFLRRAQRHVGGLTLDPTTS